MELNAINDLGVRLDEINAQCQEITKTADDEKRHLSDDERQKLKELTAEFDRLKEEMEERKKLEDQVTALSRSRGRQTPPTDPSEARRLEPRDDADDEQRSNGRTPAREPARPRDTRRWGWRSFGEFAQQVRRACRPGASVADIDRRLVAEYRGAATTVSAEEVGADGGFAVPPDFRDMIMSLVSGEDSLLGRTDQLTSSSNTITVPVDNGAPWNTTNGPQVYWIGENTAITQSKMRLEERTIKLHKLGVLTPVTDELLSDAPALDSYLRAKVPAVIDFHIAKSIVQGTGAGQPLGILNSPATVSVAKTGSQVATTLVAQNIIDMWTRCYAPARSRAVWLIHQDIETYLLRMSMPGLDNTGAAVTTWGTAAIYMPPGGLSGAPFGTLLGRPVVPTQACLTLGTKGDIILADLKSYMTATKGGIRADTSIHLYFDADVTAFRFILRIAGQPWWSAAVSPASGSNTLSPFITLDAR